MRIDSVSPVKSWRIWTAVAVVFVCGVLVGIVGARTYDQLQRQHTWEQGLARLKPRIITHLTRELRLSEEQRREAERIIGTAELELLRLRLAQQPRVEEIVGRTTETLKTVLTPEQQARLHELHDRLTRRWAADRAYLDKLESAPRP